MKAIKKVTDNLSLISDLESAEKLFEEISQDMGLHFNISDKQLKSGLGCVIQSDFCDVMNVLEAAGLSSSDVLARKMIENALEIEGVDVVSDRTSTVASGLGAQVDLAGSAPPGVASGEGPGVRVSRAGEGRDIRPGTAVGSSSAQFLGFSGGNRPNPAPQGVVVDGNDGRGNVDDGRS